MTWWRFAGLATKGRTDRMCNAIATIVIVASGWASQYAPGVMERVVSVRQTPGRTAHPLPLDLPLHSVVIAVRDCDEVGNVWLVRQTGAPTWERALVADCAGSEQTRRWMDRGRVLFEVDAATAARWATIGRGARAEVWQMRITTRGECDD